MWLVISKPTEVRFARGPSTNPIESGDIRHASETIIQIPHEHFAIPNAGPWAGTRKGGARDKQEGAKTEGLPPPDVRKAVACYVDPYRKWEGDEKENLPVFLARVGGRSRILDLAGGYGKAIPHLLQDGNSVILADESTHSVRAVR